jgi:predicted nucleic acid-binding protein
VRYVLDADVLIGALDRDAAHHQRAKELLTGVGMPVRTGR